MQYILSANIYVNNFSLVIKIYVVLVWSDEWVAHIFCYVKFAVYFVGHLKHTHLPTSRATKFSHCSYRHLLIHVNNRRTEFRKLK
jgi:hypothetical protein